MSPKRRPADPGPPQDPSSPGAPPDAVDRATTLDELRARMEQAGRPRPQGRSGGRRGGPPPGQSPDSATALEEHTTGPWWDDHRGRAIPVVDGIAASTRRGRIGTTWWSQRFLAALEAVQVGGRMQRGRSYARKGQVVALTVEPGTVSAVVQGSRVEPFRVRLTMPVTADDDWDRIIATLGSSARYAAQLLAGDLPHEMEEIFAETGASLFPGPQARLVTACTCPDFENPCKHIAAVCFLLAESFDRDPFGVLEWRGRDRTTVVTELRRLRSEPAPPPGDAGQADVDEAGPEDSGAGQGPGQAAGAGGTRDGQTGALAAEGFWVAGPGLRGVHIHPLPSAVPDAVLRQLPRDVATVRGRDLADILSGAYDAFAGAAPRGSTG